MLTTRPIRPPPTCGHSHCQRGLFYDIDPQHTHRQCHNCHKMTRFNRGSDTELRRCRGCFLEQYCSAECQKTAWYNGHRDICEIYSDVRKRATELSGDPRAWEHFMTWVRYHHSSIMNANLACLVRERERERKPNGSFRDVTSNHFLLLSVAYRNKPGLPDGKKFAVRGVRFVRYDDPALAVVSPIVQARREGSVMMGKMEFGRDYAGTGSYLVMARFGSDDAAHCAGSGPSGLPFAKHFGIDHMHARARLACRDPFEQLKENLVLGKKMRFCCGRSHKDDSCCCGGWTHALMRLEEAARSMQICDEVD